MKRLVAAVFVACCLAVPALALVLGSPPLTGDTASISGGTANRLVTKSGVWTLGSPQGSDGNWPIQLNGAVQAPGTNAINLYILNGGVLYQQTVANVWYSWTGAGPWVGPVSDPRGVPAPAAAAGFNTLIINDDFSSSTFGNPVTNWLDCNDGSTPPASPLYYRAWVGFGTNIDAPCSAITQAADPLNGQLALHLHWQDSYFTGNNGHAHGIPVQTTDGAGNGRRTPMGFYIEFVARSATQTGSFPGIDVWSYTHTNTDSYEIDGAEEAGATNMSFAIHNNDLANGSCADPNSSPPCAGAVVNITQYHTYAWRQTSAGSDIVFCAYVDGTLYGCNSISPVNAQLTSLQDMVHQMLIFVPGNYSTAGRTKEMYIKSMKVWSCAGVNSGNHCLSASNNP